MSAFLSDRKRSLLTIERFYWSFASRVVRAGGYGHSVLISSLKYSRGATRLSEISGLVATLLPDHFVAIIIVPRKARWLAKVKRN